ncbi:MAG: alanine racemase [Pseudomonadota bacterium]
MSPDLILEVNLRAISYNYRYLKTLTKAEISAVVKSDAYGLGAIPIALALEKEGCKSFFVARVEEGVKLRANGVLGTIYVLHGVQNFDVEDFVEHQLVPVINSEPQALLWQQCAKKHARKLPCIIHVDTGMNRLGMSESELYASEKMEGLEVLYVMSHLACAEEGEHEYNERQLTKFQSYDHVFPDAKRSLVNSSGIFLGNKYHYDLARPGMALYGLNPMPFGENPLKNVTRLFAKVMQIRELQEDCFVGYSCTYRAKKGTQIATIAVGYSDGYLRRLSNTGIVSVNGHKAPVIGRVSMDMSTIDVTGITCNVGDMVEVLGPNCLVDDVAKIIGTSGYELLTSLNRTFCRRYVS